MFHSQNLGRWIVGILLLAMVAANHRSATAQSLTAQSATVQPKSDSSLPDIVFILSDDQAYGDYSFMGHPHIQTPNLDRLARESRFFTRGYVPHSLCRPSLASIITGLYPYQHGIVGNDPPPVGGWDSKAPRRYTDPAYQAQIEKYLQAHIDKLETLPDRLSRLGYLSFQTGKWWEGNPTRGGFTKGMTHGDHSRGGRHGDVGLEIGRKGMQPVSEYVQAARQAGKPYFLWYAPMLPHTPHNPPEALLEKYKPLAPTEPIAKYWAMCEWFDQTIGQLREIIASQGRPDNTLIVYVTDNGWINLPNQSAYAPRSKRSPNEGGLRTPIMFCWPGHVAPARDDAHLVSSIDLVPTTLALINQPRVPELPGINVLDPAALAARNTIYGSITEHNIVELDDASSSLEYRWIIDGYQKLIVPSSRKVEQNRAGKGARGEIATIQHFDLKADPQENNPLPDEGEHQQQRARLLQQLDAWWNGNSAKTN